MAIPPTVFQLRNRNGIGKILSYEKLKPLVTYLRTYVVTVELGVVRTSGSMNLWDLWLHDFSSDRKLRKG